MQHTTSDTNAFVDVGEKLGGARKDAWTDLIKQGKDATTIAALWPKTDWRAFIKEISAREGYTDLTARWAAVTCYVVREIMIDQQKRNSAFSGGRTVKAGAELIVRYISGLQSAIVDLGEFGSDLKAFAEAVFEFATMLADDEASGVKLAWDAGIQPKWCGRARDREQLVSRLVATIKELLAAGWPDVEPKKKRGSALLIPRRPQLKREEMERKGPERPHEMKTGEDVEKVLLSTFSIRGVEYGNYVPDNGERQLNANLAYHALHDLADVLGVEPRVVGHALPGKDGPLGIGIGSRGKGALTGAAHYEPWSRVINVTRMMGDGSLAHEMGHKFDHGLADYIFDREAILAAKKEGADKRELQALIFPSERWTARPDRAPILENPDLNAAFVAAMDNMMVEDITAEHLKWTRYRQEAGKCLGRGHFGKTYWTAPCEMFARAFESYVFDWLKERGRRNDYLVHGVGAEQFSDTSNYRGNPYPTGEERQRINAAMAKLIEVWRAA